MKTKIMLALGLFSFMATGLYAQVAINNTATNPDASAILDLNSGNSGVNKGFLPPQVALTNVSTAAPVTSPATGLIVYSTSAPAGGNGVGYYYWTGTAWAPFSSSGGGVSGSGTATQVAFWNGASSLTSSTNLYWDNANSYLGISTNTPTAPLDVNQYVNWTTSIFGPIQPVCLVANQPMIGFNAYFGASGETYYSADPAAFIEFGQNITGALQILMAPSGTANTPATMTPAMTILNNTNIGIGTTSPNRPLQVSSGVFVNTELDNTAKSSYGLDVWAPNVSSIGTWSEGNALGLYSLADSSNGTGLNGINGASSGTDVGNGVYGVTYQSGGYGIYGKNLNATAGAGIGIYGQGSGSTGTSLPYGQGMYGEGTAVGVVGYADNSSGSVYPGYFSNGYGGYATVAYNNGTDYKVAGSGTVATIVNDEKGERRIMNCPEAPEILFEDYGTAKLANGKVHVDLDPIYAKNVTINEKHPLRVMITLNDQCNGVYVTNRTATGFDVIELNSGTSNAQFTYEVIANRADAYDDNGKLVSKNADNRFAPGFGPLEVKSTVGAKQKTNIVNPNTIKHQTVQVSRNVKGTSAEKINAGAQNTGKN